MCGKEKDGAVLSARQQDGDDLKVGPSRRMDPPLRVYLC